MGRFREIPIARLPGGLNGPRTFVPDPQVPMDTSPFSLPDNHRIGSQSILLWRYGLHRKGGGHGTAAGGRSADGIDTGVPRPSGARPEGGMRCLPTLTYPDWMGREERTARSMS